MYVSSSPNLVRYGTYSLVVVVVVVVGRRMEVFNVVSTIGLSYIGLVISRRVQGLLVKMGVKHVFVDVVEFEEIIILSYGYFSTPHVHHAARTSCKQ